MTDIQPYQIVVVLAFLAVLFAVQIFLKYGRVPQSPLRGADRLRLVQQIAVGPKERLLLVCVDNEEFLIACPKHGEMSVVPVHSCRPEAEEQHV